MAKKAKTTKKAVKPQKKKVTRKQSVKVTKPKSEKLEKKKEIKVRKTGKKVASKSYELSIGLEDMVKNGCHLGHRKSKSHPKAQKFIYDTRNGVDVFDLTKSIKYLEEACQFLNSQVKAGKKVCLVGTKRQAKEVVRRIAKETNMPWVTERWLGGTITNWGQIRKNINRLAELKEGLEKGEYKELTKKEVSDLRKEAARLERMVGGLSTLDKMFDVLFVVDAGFEKTAIREAKLKEVPVVAMVDTDTDPKMADYPIPVNDDNVKSINLIVEEVGRAMNGTKKSN